jgi:CRISPR-associated protein Csm3
MHKIKLNKAILDISLKPVSPLLIKSGSISRNPSLPDMQFVRTRKKSGETLYIPGSSLKGVFRSWQERILRSVNNDWTCDIIEDSCADDIEDKDSSAEIYKKSCKTCKMYGNTSLKGRVAILDAYPAGDIQTEVRYGVAISRLSQGVAQGPFDMEVAVSGKFETKILVENFEIWELGCIALVIKGINSGIIKIGFGKTKGFGQVSIDVDNFEYRFVGSLEDSEIGGVGALANDETIKEYGFIENDKISVESVKIEEGLLEILRNYDSQQWKSISKQSIEKLKEMK